MKLINKVDLKLIESVAELCKKKKLYLSFYADGEFSITLTKLGKEKDKIFADELRDIIGKN